MLPSRPSNDSNASADQRISGHATTAYSSPMPPSDGNMKPARSFSFAHTDSSLSITTKTKVTASHKIKNRASQHWGDLIKPKVSVLPAIFVRLIMFSIFAALVCVFALVPAVAFLNKLPNSLTMVTVLGVSVSLLLGFRTNTAYDKYWEGRKLFGAIQFQTINLARMIKVLVKSKTPEMAERKVTALILLGGFPVAVKHRLRDENECTYTDLVPHLENANKLSSMPLTGNIPFDMCNYLQDYLVSTEQSILPILQGISALQDSLANLERIKTTPLPKAYGIHLRQALTCYLLSLPFQIVPALKWLTIPTTLLSAFVMLGLQEIAQRIEDPFGYDLIDLPLDEFCEELAKNVKEISAREDSGSLFAWKQPSTLSVMAKNKAY
ncbi:Bestrophin, RFP-TM, chloride channel-domain-containing protein [Chytriomyces sp. MP71]|nr:Bestrophin, RFP-TM, chloride channel-domain-containing protein [Chytriomyces sp. MP71]